MELGELGDLVELAEVLELGELVELVEVGELVESVWSLGHETSNGAFALKVNVFFSCFVFLLLKPG